MSLAKLRKLDAEGVTFQSHLDGSTHRLTPARSIGIQHSLDSTITMALDECTPFPATEAEARVSMELSMRWAGLSKAAFVERDGYALFGIAQGGVHPELRRRSADALRSIGFDGYEERPRYLMGVGTPDDLIGAVARGIDMVDCVIPTRGGRTARAFVPEGTFNLRNARFADDDTPLDPACPCPACTRHSRAYLHHLFRAEEMLGPMLLTWHNLTYYQSLMRGLRDAILEGRFEQHAARLRAGWKEQP
jgi:queuine tRNA-ribosyltransferase